MHPRILCSHVVFFNFNPKQNFTIVLKTVMSSVWEISAWLLLVMNIYKIDYTQKQTDHGMLICSEVALRKYVYPIM